MTEHTTRTPGGMPGQPARLFPPGNDAPSAAGSRIPSAAAIDDVPDCLNTAMQAEGLAPPAVLLALKADLRADGTFGDRWLIVTAAELAVFGMDRTADGTETRPRLQRRFALDALSDVRARTLVGGGALEVLPQGTRRAPMEILRYSSLKERVFAAAARRLSGRLKAARAGMKKQTADAPRAEDDNDPRNPLSFADILAKEAERICPKCRGRLQEGTRVCPDCVSIPRMLLRILSFAAPYKANLALLALLVLAGMAVSLTPPLLIRFLVDNVLVPRAHLAWIPWLVLGLLAVRLLTMGLNIWRSREAVRIGGAVTMRLRAQAFRHLELLSMSWFNRQKSGQLMSRIGNDTMHLQQFLVDGIQYTVTNILLAAGIAATLIWINPMLGLLVLAPAPVVYIVMRYLMGRIHANYRVAWAAIGRMTAFLNDSLSGIRVVKAFGKEEREISRFEQVNADQNRAFITAERYWETWMPFLTLIMGTGELLVWYVGARMIVGETRALTLGDLMAYLSYMAMLYGPLMLMARMGQWAARAFTAAERIFEILDMQPEIADRPEAVHLPRIAGSVAFRKVTFGYEKHKPVLHAIDLEAKPGEMIGLVGRSGAGKSTTINLLARLFEADAGRVEIDGHDIRDIRLADLRGALGVVLQQPFLFSASVSENLTYAHPDCDREQIIRAAWVANAHEFIMDKPDGYDSDVGERGRNFSVGEQQRLTIARAILHDPRILILDEATSSVDTETEKKIQEALGRLVKNRTTIAIAHRLSTLREADRLAVFESGRIVESGTHAELMARKNGAFRRLAETQSELNKIVVYK